MYLVWLFLLRSNFNIFYCRISYCVTLPEMSKLRSRGMFDYVDVLSIIFRTHWLRYGLRTRSMPPPALHAVFQSTALAKVTYASPAWWGFTNAADRNRLEAFIRRAVRHGYCAHTTPTLSSLCDKADKTLFDSIITNSTHPPGLSTSYFHPKYRNTTLPVPAATVMNFHVKLAH